MLEVLVMIIIRNLVEFRGRYGVIRREKDATRRVYPISTGNVA